MHYTHQIRLFVKSLLPQCLMTYRLKNNSNNILLTFDDLPDHVNTHNVLYALKIKNKKAIFFVIGEKAEQYPDIVKRIHSEGHIVANHTFSHPYDRKTSLSEYRDDILKAQEVLTRILGVSPTLFRPPCGEFSLKTVVATKTSRLKMMLMSNGGGEWNQNANGVAKDVENTIMKKIKKGQIIVLHDNNSKIPEMLESLIERIEARGLSVLEALDEVV